MKPFYIFILIYSLFATLFIFNLSKVVNGERYFFLADDAMISMQYAKNIILGNGAVWSVGDKVQGYTNPLWTLYMTIPHLLNIPQSQTPLFIIITAYIFMIGTLYLVWRLSHDIIVLIFVGFFLPLNIWFYSGMEVSILTFLCTLTIYLILNNKGKELDNIIIYLICGLMIWIRIDMVLFGIFILLVYRKEWDVGLWIMGMFLWVMLLWSYSYYGDMLPNTYYLKMYHYPFVDRMMRGIATLGLNMFSMNWILISVAFLYYRNTLQEKLILGFFGLEVLYSLWIGGDVWEAQGGTNRFITMAMPLFFVVLIPNIQKATLQLLSPFPIEKCHMLKYNIIKYVVLILCFINFNMLAGKLQSFGTYIKPQQQTLNSVNTLKIALDIKSFIKNKNIFVIATQGAGILPYYSNNKHYIDLHGKCDKFIAHGEITGIHNLYDVFITAPGHIKYNQEYSIIKLKPDIIVHPINDGNDKVKQYIRDNYVEGLMDAVWYKTNMGGIN